MIFGYGFAFLLILFFRVFSVFLPFSRVFCADLQKAPFVDEKVMTNIWIQIWNGVFFVWQKMICFYRSCCECYQFHGWDFLVVVLMTSRNWYILNDETEFNKSSFIDFCTLKKNTFSDSPIPLKYPQISRNVPLLTFLLNSSQNRGKTFSSKF